MRTKRLFISFSVLALFIGCLGLLGLVAFMVQYRLREIGIRKVLGASIWGLVILLSKQFSKWVLISNIFAWPLAWYTMNMWLENFAYRSNIELWYFLIAGGIALFIALLTISAQVFRAAISNPVDTLRYE